MQKKLINLGCVFLGLTLSHVASANEQAAAVAAVNDPAVVQARVTGTCDIGSSITAIAEDGTVTC